MDDHISTLKDNNLGVYDFIFMRVVLWKWF